MTRRATAAAALLALSGPLLGVLPAEARPRYLDDVPLTSGTPGYNAIVETTPRGVTLAVWGSAPYSSQELTFAVHRPGGTWTTPAPVADIGADLTDDAPNFDLVMDRTGRVTAIWTRTGGTSAVVATASWTQQAGWTDPVDLSVDGDGARFVDLDVDRAGNLTATWSDTQVVTRWKPAGRAWQATRRVPGSAPSQVVSTATDATGRQLVLWTQFDGTGDPDVHQLEGATRRTGAGRWNDVGLTVEQDVVLAEAVAVRGGLLALWRNDETHRLETRFKPSGEDWRPLRAIATDPVGLYADTDGRGRATVVIERSDPEEQLVSRVFDGDTWTPREVIATDVDTFRSALDVSATGQAGVQFRTTDGTVWTSRRLASGWGDPHELGSSEPGQVQADGLGVDDLGNLVALWNRSVIQDLVVSTLDAGKPVTRIERLTLDRRTGKLFVRWSASDRWSPITAVTIELRFAKPGGGFSPWRPWPRPYTLASRTATATVAKDKRWCVHVRTTDGTGSASRFVTKCTRR